MPLPASDKYLDLLELAITLLVSGDTEAANQAAREFLAERPGRVPRRSISAPMVVSILRRDGCMCRYCGAKVVPAPVLRAASSVWPEELPYNLNFRADAVHPIFVARSASIDHVNPHAHSGTDDLEGNLVTSCWPCNAQKSEFTLERLGWELLPPTTNGWEGFVPAYPELWRIGQERREPSAAEVRYHAKWLRAFGFTDVSIGARRTG